MFRAASCALALGSLLVAGCARGGSSDDTSATQPDSVVAPDQQPGAAGGGGGGGGGGSDAATLRSEIQRLEARARAIAKAGGCQSSGQCKAAPVGERACGGPREYIVYCPLNTDEAALTATLDSLKRAEMKLNEMEGIISTCEYRMPPEMEVVGGMCKAK